MQECLDPIGEAGRLRKRTEQTIREAAEALHVAETGLNRRHLDTPRIAVLRNELQVLSATLRFFEQGEFRINTRETRLLIEAREVLQLCRSAAGLRAAR
jgi:hypothetical protein